MSYYRVFALNFNTITNGGDMVSPSYMAYRLQTNIGRQHLGIAQFYDLPVISLRNAAYRSVLQNESLIPEYFFVSEKGEIDTRHVRQMPLDDMFMSGIIELMIDIMFCRSAGKVTISWVDLVLLTLRPNSVRWKNLWLPSLEQTL